MVIDIKYYISITEDGTIYYPLHKHTFCEIMLYSEGCGYLKTENGDIPFEGETAIIVPKNTMHGSVSERGFKNISIGGDFENLLFFNNPIAIKVAADSKILGKLIYEKRLSDNSYLSSLVSCYIISLLQTLQSSSQKNIAINKIIKNISENALNHEFNITSALKKSGYAEDYIRAEFKTATGKTPIEFVNSFRIEHACRLIDIYGTNMSVTEISEKCGFSNSAYFSRVFKIIKSVNPQQYIKNTIYQKQ